MLFFFPHMLILLGALSDPYISIYLSYIYHYLFYNDTFIDCIIFGFSYCIKKA